MLETRAEPPVAGPGEAVLRPLRIGVPASLDGVVGPVTLGQEFVGVVESLHEDADKDLRKRWVGKRVVGSPTIACSRCDMCRAGFATHCRARRVMGVNGWDGCMAEAFTLPLRNLYEVSTGVDDDRAVFALALAGALHAAQLVRIEGKPYVTVLGDTLDGLLCAQVMARLNASVRLLGARPERFTLCEKWGIKHRHEGEVGRRADQDIVVDCTGAASGLTLALQMVRPRGKIVLRDAPRAGAPALEMLVEKEVEMLGARVGSMADALSVLARGEMDVLSLITRRGRLADGVSAVAQAGEQIKIVMEP